MSMQQILFAGSSTTTDPYFANVVSLIHFDGANLQVAPYSDVVRGASAWADIAANTLLVTAIQKFGATSLNTGNVGVYNPDHADWNFGSGDYTVECWVRLAIGGLFQTIFAQWNSGSGEKAPFLCYTNASNQVVFGASTTNASWDWLQTSATTLTPEVWYHVAICRSGTTVRGFIDGVEAVTSGTLTGAVVNNTTNVTIGNTADNPGSLDLQGHIDEFRATKGVARYTSNFTPSTTAFPDS
jgi:hypothetical protein